MQRGEPIWMTSSTSPTSMPSSSEAVATTHLSSPALEPLLGVEAGAFGEAAVVGGDHASSPRRSPRSWATRSARRRVLHEDERGAVLRATRTVHAIIDLRHLLFAEATAESVVVRDFDAEVERADCVAGVDEMARSGARGVVTDEQAGDALDGFLTVADRPMRVFQQAAPAQSVDLDLSIPRSQPRSPRRSHRPVRAERVEAFEADREVAAALAADERRGSRRRSPVAAVESMRRPRLAGQQQVEAIRGW
jgi:hypothetical protein